MGCVKRSRSWHEVRTRRLRIHRVVVIRFADGGLISYRKADGSYIHTLNTCDGLHRKLAQLGIE